MNQELNRKQSVVFFSDIVGYTRLMGKDEDRAFGLMKQNLLIHQEIFAKYSGQIVKELGDGILGFFDTPLHALSASLEIQQACLEQNEFQLRIGLHSGDIIFDHGDIFGDAVNQSSRIQSVGVPSCILISDHLYQQLPPNSPYTSVRLGSFELKNVAHKVELHAISNPPLSIPKRSDILQNIKYQEQRPWLKWTIGAVFLAIIFALVITNYWKATPWGKEKSVVVLPFENLGNDPAHEYFSEGLTGDIIYQLSEIDSIKVIPFEQVLGQVDSNWPLDSIRKKFQVSTLLKGTVEFMGSKVQVNVRLIDLSNSTNIWTQSFTRENTGVVSIQNNIAIEIARALNANMSPTEMYQIGKTQTTNAQAYDDYLKAKSLYFKYNKEANLAAIELFRQAIKLDPNYSLAYSGLADCYSQMPGYGFSMAWLDSSREANNHALTLEPTLAEAYLSNGMIYYYEGKNEYAKISFEKALAYKPTLSRATGNLATIYFAEGDFINALMLQQKSASQNPKAFIPYQISGWIYRILGDYELALEYLNQANEKQINPVNYEQLAYTYISMGKIQEAKSQVPLVLKNVQDTNSSTIAGLISFYLNELDTAQKYFEHSLANTEAFEEDPYYVIPINLAYILKQKGELARANELLEISMQVRIESMINGDGDYNLPHDLAIAHMIKGNYQEAIKFLNIAYDKGWRDLMPIEHHPAFSPIKSRPEFQEIVKKIQNNLIAQKQKLEPTSLLRDK